MKFMLERKYSMISFHRKYWPFTFFSISLFLFLQINCDQYSFGAVLYDSIALFPPILFPVILYITHFVHYPYVFITVTDLDLIFGVQFKERFLYHCSFLSLHHCFLSVGLCYVYKSSYFESEDNVISIILISHKYDRRTIILNAVEYQQHRDICFYACVVCA